MNNMLFFHGLLGTVEAMVLAGKAGVDLGALRYVVQASSSASFVWDYASKAILKDRLVPHFTVALAAKDAALAVDLADTALPPLSASYDPGGGLRQGPRRSHPRLVAG